MRLITGDECGLLKEYIPELSRKKEDPDANAKPFTSMPDVVTKKGVYRIDAAQDNKQTRARGVVDMMWMGSDNCHEDFAFAALRNNGCVELWQASADTLKDHGNYSMFNSTRNVFEDDTPRPLGMGVFAKHQRICAGDMLGNVVVTNLVFNDQRNYCRIFNRRIGGS